MTGAYKGAGMKTRKDISRWIWLVLGSAAAFAPVGDVCAREGFKAVDPGPRKVDLTPAPNTCNHASTTSFDPRPIAGLTAEQTALFCAGWDEFSKVDSVDADGLGPTFNFTSCQGCHAYPHSGGSSPAGSNPQFAFAQANPSTVRKIPWFMKADGPIREVRFKKNADGSDDGGVHAIYTITGLAGAGSCKPHQEDFDAQRKNMIFRIPTPTFGLGLVEQITDQAIIDNQKKNQATRYGSTKMKGYAAFTLLPGRLNIVRVGHTRGTENRNGNDGTIARFGWKAQNKSLLVFSGEAYNVEMGISNELFQTERNEEADCQTHDVPNDTTGTDNFAAATLKSALADAVAVDDRVKASQKSTLDTLSDIEKFSAFMRFLAPPEPSKDSPGGAASIQSGYRTFMEIGCGHCHSPEMRTSTRSAVQALRDKPVALYSDLAIHKMGTGLADGVSQGQAGKDEFRSAPLWGAGQRVFFLHDGRASNLVEAIAAHESSGSQASPVIRLFKRLDEDDQRDVLNFLRSL